MAEVTRCVGCGERPGRFVLEYPIATGPWCKPCVEQERERIRANLNAWADREILSDRYRGNIE